MGGSRRQADGGLDVRSEVLEGLGDGADARAARHAGHADCDAAGGWHVASLLFVEEIVSLALALLLLRRDSGGRSRVWFGIFSFLSLQLKSLHFFLHLFTFYQFFSRC